MKKVSKKEAPVQPETEQVLNIKEELDEIRHLLSVICDTLQEIKNPLRGGY